MASELTKEVSKRKIDPFTTFVPFGCVLALCAYFVLAPENSTNALEVIRSFLGDKCGVYYLSGWDNRGLHDARRESRRL